tara:strand:- start:35 stop:277 length:243 start_codon:yes stop_codon:yes gene_type:complete
MLYYGNMQEKISPITNEEPESELSNDNKLVSLKTIAEATEVSPRTVSGWVKDFGWKPVKFNSRLIRYHKSEVEGSLGINL